MATAVSSIDPRPSITASADVSRAGSLSVLREGPSSIASPGGLSTGYPASSGAGHAYSSTGTPVAAGSSLGSRTGEQGDQPRTSAQGRVQGSGAGTGAGTGGLPAALPGAYAADTPDRPLKSSSRGVPSSPTMSGLGSRRSRSDMPGSGLGSTMGGFDATAGSDSASAVYRASQRELAQQAFTKLQGLDDFDVPSFELNPDQQRSRAGSKSSGHASSGLIGGGGSSVGAAGAPGAAGSTPMGTVQASPSLTGVTGGSEVSGILQHRTSSHAGSQIGSTPSLPLTVTPAAGGGGHKLAAKRYSSMDEFEGLMQGEDGAMIADREPAGQRGGQGGAGQAGGTSSLRSASVSALSPTGYTADRSDGSELESLLSAVGVPTVQGIKRSLTRAYSGIGPGLGLGAGAASGSNKGARGSVSSLASQASFRAASMTRGSSGVGSGLLGSASFVAPAAGSSASATGAGTATGARSLSKRHSSQNTVARKYAGLSVSSSAQTEEEDDGTWGNDGTAAGHGGVPGVGALEPVHAAGADVPSLAGLGPFVSTAGAQPALSFPASPPLSGSAGPGAAGSGGGVAPGAGARGSQASAIVSQGSSTGLSVINEEEGGPTPPTSTKAAAVTLDGIGLGSGAASHTLSSGGRSQRADTDAGALGELDLALVGANEGRHAPLSSVRSLQGAIDLRSPGVGGVVGADSVAGAGDAHAAGGSSASGGGGGGGGLVMLLGHTSSFKGMHVAAGEPVMDLDGLEDDELGGMMVADHSPKHRHSGHGGHGRSSTGTAAGAEGAGAGKKPESAPEYSPPGSSRSDAPASSQRSGGGGGGAGGDANSARGAEGEQPSMQRAGTIGITRMLSTMNKEVSLASKNEAAKRKQKAQRRLSAAMAAGLFIAKMAGSAGLHLDEMSPRRKDAEAAAAAAAAGDVVIVQAAAGPGGSAADALEEEEEDEDVVDIPSLGVSIRLLPTSMPTASAIGTVFSEEEYHAYKHGLLHRVLTQSEKDIRRTALGLPLSPVSTDGGGGGSSDGEHMLLTSDGWGMFDPALEKIALAQAAGMGNAMEEDMQGAGGPSAAGGGAGAAGSPGGGPAAGGAGADAAQREPAGAEGAEGGGKTRRGSVRTSADDARRARKAAGYNPQQTAFLDQARMSRSVTRAVGGGPAEGGTAVSPGGRLDFVGLASSSHPEDGGEDDVTGRPGLGGGAQALDMNGIDTDRAGPGPFSARSTASVWDTITNVFSPKSARVAPAPNGRGRSETDPAASGTEAGRERTGSNGSPSAKGGGGSGSAGASKRGGGGLLWLCCGASEAQNAQIVQPSAAPARRQG